MVSIWTVVVCVVSFIGGWITGAVIVIDRSSADARAAQSLDGRAKLQPGVVTTAKVVDLLMDSAGWDGDHHKQWFVVEALKELGVGPSDLEDFDPGIPP